MAVHNKNYKEILGLLGDMYVKYIDIDNLLNTTNYEFGSEIKSTKTNKEKSDSDDKYMQHMAIVKDFYVCE